MLICKMEFFPFFASPDVRIRRTPAFARGRRAWNCQGIPHNAGVETVVPRALGSPLLLPYRVSHNIDLFLPSLHPFHSLLFSISTFKVLTT